MARRDYAGAAVQTTVSAQVNPADLSISISSATGWPTGGANGEFFITLSPDEVNEERVLVQSLSGTTLTIANTGKRGVDDTVAGTHPTGSVVYHSYAAIEADEANFHINDITHDQHTQYMRTDGTRHDLTARHSAGTVVPTAAPTTITPDASSTEGAGTSLARATHVHGISTTTPVSIGTALAEGAGTDFARATHVHDLAAGVIDDSTFFAADVVNAAAIAANAVGSSELADNAVDAAAIQNAIIPFTKFAFAAPSTWAVTFGGLTGASNNTYASYFKLGPVVVAFAGFRIGAGGNVVSTLSVNLPVNATDIMTFDPGNSGFICAGRSFDASAGQRTSGLGFINDSSIATGFATAGSTAVWDGVTPFNWAEDDIFQSIIVYWSTA